MGYALGALLAGAVADALGYGGAIAIVAGLTATSGLWVLGDMPAHRAPVYVSPHQSRVRTPRRIDLGRYALWEGSRVEQFKRYVRAGVGG